LFGKKLKVGHLAVARLCHIEYVYLFNTESKKNAKSLKGKILQLDLEISSFSLIPRRMNFMFRRFGTLPVPSS